MTVRDVELRRAEQARRLLEDPLLKQAFEAVAAHWRTAWLTSGETDVAGRERCWLALRLLRQLQGELEDAVTTGRLAALAEAGERASET
jgi:hypothetical protein